MSDRDLLRAIADPAARLGFAHGHVLASHAHDVPPLKRIRFERIDGGGASGVNSIADDVERDLLIALDDVLHWAVGKLDVVRQQKESVRMIWRVGTNADLSRLARIEVLGLAHVEHHRHFVEAILQAVRPSALRP